MLPTDKSRKELMPSEESLAASSTRLHRNNVVDVNRAGNTMEKSKPKPSWLQHVSSDTGPVSAANKTKVESDGIFSMSIPSATRTPSKEAKGNNQYTDNASTSTSPYPALEYPPLYFILRHVPCLLRIMQSFYAFRWWISYPLQRRVVLSRQLRHLQIYMTYGELLLLLPYYVAVSLCILYTMASPSVLITGKLCRATLIMSLMFSQRNSFITLFVGIPVDRGVFYRKLAGRIAGVTGILHTAAYYLDPKYRPSPASLSTKEGIVEDLFANSINISGTVMIMILAAMIVTSMKPIRRMAFEVFYYLHIIFAMAFVVCTYYHSGMMVPSIALAIIGFDWIVRFILMALLLYPKKASIQIMTESVVELTFPKTSTFPYNPGQYVYIAIPEITCFQFHPFSIVSAPNDPTVRLLIRKLGNWTTELHNLAKTKSQISLLIEGPYGNLSLDLMASDRKYRHVLLISGGIGITPMESICDHLINEVNAGRRQELRQIKFVWVERETAFLEQTEKSLKEKASQSSINTLSTSFSGTTSYDDDGSAGSVYIDDDDIVDVTKDHLSLQLLDLPSCGMPQEDSHEANLELSPEEMIETENSVDLEEEKGNIRTGEDVFDLELYLASADGRLQLDRHRPNKNIRFGRPNVADIFLRMKRDVLLESLSSISTSDSDSLTTENITIRQHHIAVCVSAPMSLTNACRMACLMYSDEYVRFDLHYESMSF